MAYTDTWDAAFEAYPDDSDDASEGAERIRDLKLAIRERLAHDHYMAIAGTDADHGEHTVVTLREQSAPAAAAAKGKIYARTDGGATELYYMDAAGNETKLTSAGVITSELSALLTAEGDMVYASAANTPARLAKGTAYQILQMNAAATAPTWFTLPGYSSAAAAGTRALRSIGTGATDACAGNDSRLSDARTPEVYTGTNGAYYTFPIGTCLVCSGPAITRCAEVDVYLTTTASLYTCVAKGATKPGGATTKLSGSWRHRGAHYNILVQRVS